MFKNLYNKSILFVIGCLLVVFLSQSWSSICSNIAVRMYYGNKSKWDSYTIVTNLDQGSEYVERLLVDIYDQNKKPLRVIILTKNDCYINKCKPDVIYSTDSNLVEDLSIQYGALPLDDELTVDFYYAGISDLSENNAIYSMYLYNKDLFFSFPYNSNKKTLSRDVFVSMGNEIIANKVQYVKNKLSVIMKNRKKLDQEKKNQVTKKRKEMGLTNK